MLIEDINISGTIGVSFLKKENKKIIIFYDDHSNTKYCNNSYFINNFLDEINLNTNGIILLEEPFLNKKDNENIIYLWDNVPHIVKSKNFYNKIVNKCTNKKICRVFPVDLRLSLIDISIEEYLSNIKNSTENINNENVNDYFKYFIYLFDVEKVDLKKFSKTTNIYFIKDVFSTFIKDEYYVKMKKTFIEFYEKFLKNHLNEKMTDFIEQYKNLNFEYIKGFPFINNDEDNFITQFNRIHNNIMEFYAVIIIVHSNYPNIIMYSGYYHSNNISYILEHYYKFSNDKNIGYVNDIDNYDENNIKNCIKINKNIIQEYLK
jgi:hypothetical protein